METLYKLILVLVLIMFLVSCGEGSTGTSDSFVKTDVSSVDRPVIKYYDSSFELDPDNKTIHISDNYIIDNSHPYDVVETDDGYDLVLHFVDRK